MLRANKGKLKKQMLIAIREIVSRELFYITVRSGTSRGQGEITPSNKKIIEFAGL